MIRVFNKDICRNILDIEKLIATVKRCLTFQSPFIRKILS